MEELEFNCEQAIYKQPLDMPDSEGWWWLFTDNDYDNPVCVKIFIDRYDNMVFRNLGKLVLVNEIDGKWIKAIVPEMANNDVPNERTD